MSTLQPSAPIAPSQPLTLSSSAPVESHGAEDEVAPSRAMEYWLFGIMVASLAVSISGLAFVYGFNLADPFSLSNVSPGVRGIIVDSIMFLGVYFTRRFLMYRKKQSWHWFWGIVWLLVAVLATSFSWFSNTLAVNALGTSVTQSLLNRSGFGSWDAAKVNQVIAALPIVAILLYGIVPRRMKAAPSVVDTRTPEQILQAATQEAARIQAGRILRQVRAEEVGEGLGEGISALARGMNLALGRDPAARHAERKAEAETLRQMRVLLLRHGWVESLDKAMKLRPEQVRLLAETKQLWNPSTNQPMPWALLPTTAEKRAELRKLALANHWLTPEEVVEEDDMSYAALEARYADLELRAEALRQQREAQAPDLSAGDKQAAPGAVRKLQASPGVSSPPVVAEPGTRAAERDGFTPFELGKRLGKSRGTITNWMKEDAKEPLKIYAQEVFRDARGNQRISPDAYLRLSRVLAEEGSWSLHSSPRKVKGSTTALEDWSHADSIPDPNEART